MEEEKKKAYSEVVEVLKLIEDEKKLEKIPFEVIELIKRNAEPGYKPSISKEIPLEDQNLRNETYSILGWIANKYWNENIEIENSEEHRVDLKEENVELVKVQHISSSKEIIEGSEDNNFEVNNNIDERAAVYNDIDPQCLQSSKLPVVVSDIKWYQKIKIQVIRFFKLIFGIKDKEENNMI